MVRLAGRGAFDIARRVIPTFLPVPRLAQLASFVGPGGDPIDRGLYTVFPAPHSFSGDDTVEFSCHGGQLAPRVLLEALFVAGARQALPGEFTRRAVLNGRLDLIQAEAVGDLVDATAEEQGKAALRQLDGQLSRRVEALRQALLGLLAMLSYDIDFPDEDDGPVSRTQLVATLDEVAGTLEHLLGSASTGERIRNGALVVLAGRPNAGKSSLFNALIGTDRALVTEVPGTTRDAIEAAITCVGWPVRLVDTAGLRESGDRIESMGVEVSRRWLAAADLVLLCVEAFSVVTDEEQALLNDFPALLVSTKSDLTDSRDGVSAVTGDGLDSLRQNIAQQLFSSNASVAEIEPMLTRDRHRIALGKAQVDLLRARPFLSESDGDPLLAAHHIQGAAHSLAELIGTVDVEDVLGEVFRGFCVGK